MDFYAAIQFDGLVKSPQMPFFVFAAKAEIEYLETVQIDDPVKSLITAFSVIPVKTGIQSFR